MGCPLSIIFLAIIISWWVLRMNRVIRAQENRIEELQRICHLDEVDQAREDPHWLKDTALRTSQSQEHR
jgi:hypothetical protein